jgi:hypothetical protein
MYTHAFGIPYRTCTGDIINVLEAGDIRMVSFHATKMKGLCDVYPRVS